MNLYLEKLKLQPIGNGAYANVYSFKEDLTGKKFALKKLKREIKDNSNIIQRDIFAIKLFRCLEE